MSTACLQFDGCSPSGNYGNNWLGISLNTNTTSGFCFFFYQVICARKKSMRILITNIFTRRKLLIERFVKTILWVVEAKNEIENRKRESNWNLWLPVMGIIQRMILRNQFRSKVFVCLRAWKTQDNGLMGF